MLFIMYMNIVWFLIIGIVSGWIAGEITKGHGFGWIGNMIVGIAGALIGGFLFDAVGLQAYGTVARIVMSVIGALILLFLASLFGKNRTPISRV